MIKSFLKLLLSAILVLFIFSLNNFTFWSYTPKNQYISLTPQTSKNTVIKFQKFFKALKIYPWKIDWKYSSIKPYITKFQLKHKIIKSKNDNWAGYIWPKTYNFFEKKAGNKFYKAYLKFFPELKEDKIENQKCFIVSAYYSPLPNQKKYSTKSYQWDIKLNWSWIKWASWHNVHPWFIAAPKAYPFWTKIQLEWLWVWVVEDRGGAIVRKWVRWHECDRLDIWMWYWDAWLNRALKWWKRKVSWKIIDKNSKITISFPSEYREYLAVKIKPESSKSDLEKMQKLFKQAKLYNWKIDWKYSSFKNSIIDFQVKNKIIANKNDYAAGYIWKKTISKLEEIYPQIFIYVRKEDIKNDENKPKEKKFEKENKTWIIPKKKIIKKISLWYKLTDKQKNNLDKILKKIKKKSKRNRKKIRKKLILAMTKIKNEKIKIQINYLINKIKVN